MSSTDTKITLLKLIELSVAVFRGPDAATWDKINSAGLPELLERVQKFSLPVASVIQEMRSVLDQSLASAEGISSLETEYVRLFIAGQGGVPAPLYESCYHADEPQTMGHSAQEMRARLEQVGLAVSLDSNEPPDHLTIELEYLFFLLSEGWFGNDAQAAMGADFAKTIMLPWMRLFRDALAESDPHPVFLQTADIALYAVEAVDTA
ncbi:TorD/DmsD family molecular chaperone [Pseudodesulfovibrio sediminis]|uniref:Molecular chaperone TorD n=1 Tax=Pseudodesulfovibrio sediminis TaxID=2810563 RepID=A0ABM7P8H4_9BACT|nr:molecular chaperone TorD family protein [Pseudodesulfovibrio sediminis]BCS89320.1 hypothetical protein PSDVSF_25620 [Pseudodesulfovibrio sediminis]